jgi:hypothetical protein
MTDSNLTPALPAPADGHVTLLVITHNNPTPAWA